MTTDVSSPEYWSSIYQANDAGWDKGVCAPPIARMLREGIVAAGSRIAVIGCGRGHEAIEAASLGFDVVAIDFAPEAIAGVLDNSRAKNVRIEPLMVDLFQLGAQFPGHFDAILEHTCFCAIDPNRRSEYSQVMHQALKPTGVLFGLFYAHKNPGGPPYATTDSEVRDLFLPHFEFARLTIPADSFGNRLGNELEFIARPR